MYCNLVYYWLLRVSLKSMPFQVFDAVSSQLLSTETMNVLSSSEFLFVIWVRDFNFLIPRIPKYNDSFAKRYNIMAAIQINFIKTILYFACYSQFMGAKHQRYKGTSYFC